ncbi:hypothetical protein BX616_000991 [Lobosporangium transversale]|uniref:Hyaluronan/mRNA-binding protein domain-containing protein n=1 Tax=Lobosporangium transversale TaxID=64571 RepID=A0A1Y2GND5_9FUNG|nr:hypothetical protein BCR41DRAFT_352969 [Lobosporangium transversale]KAF9905522.1 hypothetical protein BX616_000991 [Lobosporangium transversale]ORZ16691.1 hypothetical protein BCR41DRAFT_352969 [Lobosporangium transversale]|eukprot:XP_021881626.1 hypothetical protein BCR41DRAFT_352969 [Lobosporangium transversale]
MASTNIFDLLNDDAQDQEIQVPAVKKEVKSAAKPAAKPAAGAARTADNKAPRKDGARGGKPRDGDDRAPRGPRFDRVDRAPRDGTTPRNRGPRPSRGGRHGGFDRHSGTGIVDSENKENNRLGDPTESSLEAEKDAALVAETPVAEPEPVEPEVVVKTLDDYLAEKAAKSVKLSLPQTRAANAGADDSQWKDARVLEVEEAEDFIKMGKGSEPKTRKGKKEGKVLFTDIDIRYTEPSREQSSSPRGGFRGGRGGDRGARGSRGARGGNNSPVPRRGGSRGTAVNVDDQEVFPSLGSK